MTHIILICIVNLIASIKCNVGNTFFQNRQQSFNHRQTSLNWAHNLIIKLLICLHILIFSMTGIINTCLSGLHINWDWYIDGVIMAFLFRTVLLMLLVDASAGGNIPAGTWHWINVVSTLIQCSQHWNNIDPMSCARWDWSVIIFCLLILFHCF